MPLLDDELELPDETLFVPVLRTAVDDEPLDDVELPAETLFVPVLRNEVDDELLDELLLLVEIVPPVTRIVPLFDEEPVFDELLDELPPWRKLSLRPVLVVVLLLLLRVLTSRVVVDVEFDVAVEMFTLVSLTL